MNNELLSKNLNYFLITLVPITYLTTKFLRCKCKVKSVSELKLIKKQIELKEHEIKLVQIQNEYIEKQIELKELDNENKKLIGENLDFKIQLKKLHLNLTLDS